MLVMQRVQTIGDLFLCSIHMLAKSSCEAKYRAIAQMAYEMMWLKFWFKNLAFFALI